MKYVDADPAEPDGEDEDERDVVDGGEEGQVEAGALAVEPRRADVDEERDRVADDADENDDRQNVDVQNGDDALEFGARVVREQIGQLERAGHVASSSCVETGAKVFQ